MRPSTLLTCLLLWLAASWPCSADPLRQFHRVRPLDHSIGRLLSRGYGTSPTFRALVDELERSDVIVHIQQGSWQFTVEALRVRDQRLEQGLDYEDLPPVVGLGASLTARWRFARGRDIVFGHDYMAFDAWGRRPSVTAYGRGPLTSAPVESTR